MKLEIIDGLFSVMKLPDSSTIPDKPFVFSAKTDNEVSLVCRTCDAPSEYTERDDDWRAFRVKGQLEFSLIGVLAGIAQTLAEVHVSVFCVSTYDTDYVLTHACDFDKAISALREKGYEFSINA